LIVGGRSQFDSCALDIVFKTPTTEPMVGVLLFFCWVPQDVAILHQSPRACRESASGSELRNFEVEADVYRLGTQVTGTRCFPGRTDSQIPSILCRKLSWLPLPARPIALGQAPLFSTPFSFGRRHMPSGGWKTWACRVLCESWGVPGRGTCERIRCRSRA
jgi:hypothetical protein